MRQLVQRCILWGTAITATYDYMSKILPYTMFFRVLLRPLIVPGMTIFPIERTDFRSPDELVFLYLFNIVSYALLLLPPLWVLSRFQKRRR